MQLTGILVAEGDRVGKGEVIACLDEAVLKVQLAAQANGRLRRNHAGDHPAAQGRPAVVSKDEHPRAGTTIEALAKLPTPFRQGGTVTAGNASGVNDGAAALIVASEAAVKKYGLTPIARILGGAAAGVAPRIMGIGPAPATQKLCARLGLTPQQFDVIGGRYGLATMCIGVGQGIAIALERV